MDFTRLKQKIEGRASSPPKRAAKVSKRRRKWARETLIERCGKWLEADQLQLPFEQAEEARMGARRSNATAEAEAEALADKVLRSVGPAMAAGAGFDQQAGAPVAFDDLNELLRQVIGEHASGNDRKVAR